MDPNIEPPDDGSLRNIIDKLAQFVARNGPSFEEMTKTKQINNPKFNFLFGGKHYGYYRYRVSIEEFALKNQKFLPGSGPNSGLPQMPPRPPIPHLNPSYSSSPMYPQMNPVPQAQSPGPRNLPGNLSGYPKESFHNPEFRPPPNNNDFLQQPAQPSNWPLPPPPTQQPQPPPPSIAVNNSIQNIDSQIVQLQDHIKESEKNLAAQYDVIMGPQKETKIQDMINKALDDELKQMCEDYNINLNEFNRVLQPIIDTCRKESIANGKIWIFNNCSISEHYEAVAKHLLKKITRVDSNFEAKLHLMYLINDILNHCMRKNDEKLKDAIVKIIVPAFASALMEANDEQKLKISKLLNIWEMNQYLDQSLLDQLKLPEESLEAYKTSLREKYANQIEMINEEQTIQYGKIQQQHNDFLVRCNVNIQQLQHQKQQALQQQQQSNMPIPPPFSSVPNPPNLFPPIPGPVLARPPTHPSIIPPAAPNFVPSNSVARLPRPPFMANLPVPTDIHPPLPLPQQPAPAVPAPPQPAPSPVLNIPPGDLYAPSPEQPDLASPPTTQTEPIPYFEQPAGIMAQLIKLEDFDYNPIDPEEVKVPPLLPPTDRLVQALEAFYAPPSHEHPRNPEGWEKLGLYEFFKAKSQARRKYDTKVYDKKSNSEMRTRSPPKRTFKEFRENESPEQTYERDRSSSNKNHRKRSKSRSRSRSLSPRSSSHDESPPYKSRRKSRSRSPDSPAFKTIFDKQDVSFRSKDSHVNNNGAGKKHHHQFKEINWSEKSGFGVKNPSSSNISEPSVSGSSSDQYRGFGIDDDPGSYSGTDPFESFRRNKGQAYIQRIKNARKD